jgi:hypothetical protein
MAFFSRFPILPYDIKNNDNYKLIPDILRRVKIRTAIRGASMLFDSYDVKNGERPEDIAFKWFGDAELHWVILMTNNVLDRYYDWPMNDVQFQEFLIDKYTNPDAVHHYEITKTSGNTTGEGPTDYSHLVEVNSDEPNAISISNRQFEEREQDKKRSIKLLDKRYLTDFVDEFNNLISR